MMKRISIVTLLILVASIFASGQPARKADEKALMRLNQQYDRAIVGNDVKALDRIFHVDFIYTNPDGQTRTREQQLAFARSGDLQFESGVSDSVRIRIYGNTAVMTGRFTAKGKFKGQDLTVDERYTAVWVKTGSRWQLVAEQGNLIKE